MAGSMAVWCQEGSNLITLSGRPRDGRQRGVEEAGGAVTEEGAAALGEGGQAPIPQTIQQT